MKDTENIKAKAWEFIERCKITTLPINPMELNCSDLNFKILSYLQGKEYIELLNLVEYSKVHKGFTVSLEGKIFIFYDECLTSAERNFTIAHEIAHIVLGHTSSNNILGKSDDETVQSQQEHEADIFAYALLAPAPVLLRMRVYSPHEISRLTGLNLKNSQKASDEVIQEEMFKGKGIDERLVRLFDNYINNYLKYNEEQYIKEQEQCIKEQKQYIKNQEQYIRDKEQHINYQKQYILNQEQYIKQQEQHIRNQEQCIIEQEQLAKLKLSKIKYIFICICSLLIFGSSIMYFFITQNIKNNSSIENTNVVPNQIIQNDMPKVEDTNIQDLHNNVENENIENVENIENEISELQQEESSGKTVFITPTGKKYHRESCRYANKNSIEVSIEQAKELNLLPCNSCNPDD